MKIPKRYEHCTLENYKADSLEKQEVLQAVAGYGCNFSALRKNGAAITLRGTGGTSRLHYTSDGWDTPFRVCLCRDHQRDLIGPVQEAVRKMREEREVGRG